MPISIQQNLDVRKGGDDMVDLMEARQEHLQIVPYFGGVFTRA